MTLEFRISLSRYIKAIIFRPYWFCKKYYELNYSKIKTISKNVTDSAAA